MVYRLEHGKILIEQLCLILGEIADLDIMSHLQLTCEGNLSHDTFHEGGFALTVLTHKGHFLTSFNSQCHMIENGMGAIVLTHLVADDRIVSASETGRELQMHRRVIHLVDLDGNNLLQLFDLLLHLNSLRSLIPEALDKRFHVCHFLLLVLVGSQLLFTTFLAEYDVFVVFHLVVDHPSTGDFQRTVRHIIDKSPIVTHQHHRTRTLCQELLQPLDRLDIKVVRGLVEQQHIRFLQKDLRQFNTHTPTAGELRRGTLEVRT